MAATKEQERKALEKIKKIVEELGEGSYIGMAFEGCFEIAEQNIENDWACSMKQRAEKAKKDADYFQQAANTFSEEADKLRKENEKLRGKALTLSEAGAIKNILIQRKMETSKKAESAAQKIVEFADQPESGGFQTAVVENRRNARKAEECDKLIQRLLETMR